MKNIQDSTKNVAPVKDATQPYFLSTVVTPLDHRTEMGKVKMPKMCNCFLYGN